MRVGFILVFTQFRVRVRVRVGFILVFAQFRVRVRVRVGFILVYSHSLGSGSGCGLVLFWHIHTV